MNDMAKRVAVVSGANKGVGFAIVRGLCKQFQGDVYLTARNKELGLKAVADLQKDGLNPKFHQLDLNDKESINKLKAFLQSEYGGLDILVNNAAIAYQDNSSTPFSEQAENSIATNFRGTLDVCEVLFPLLRPQARVVNVSSLVSAMCLGRCSAELQQRFTDPTMSMDELIQLMQQFVDSSKMNKHLERGWPNSSYGISKIGVTVMSLIQQREMDKDKSRSDIVINVCCPGYVNTDMTLHKGTKTIDEGADTPLYLALLPPGTTSPKGNFVSDRKIKDWKPIL